MSVPVPPPTAADEEGWAGAGGRPARGRFSWNGVLWSLIHPQRGHRVVPTAPGVVLIGLALGIGIAAYNSASNILFITLSLLLACLILSGVLNWLNLRRVEWRLRPAPRLRVDHDAVVTLELRNRRAFLPTYGLWFDLAARTMGDDGVRAESTLTGRGLDLRALWRQADSVGGRTRLFLDGRLEPGGRLSLPWVLRPERRGRLRLELAAVGSLFPFGFLRKEVATGRSCEVVVWPAPVAYRRLAAPRARRSAGEDPVRRAGQAGDLLAVRRYVSGDSHRLIHWKASARTGQLLVRQLSEEGSEGCDLGLWTDAVVWPRPEQFELLVAFAASVAEDLFRTRALGQVSIDGGRPFPVRRLGDLEHFLDRLAVLQPTPGAAGGGPAAGGNVVTFAPDGTRGVLARLDGQPFASV